jgi:hypothetical protein
MFEGKNMMDWAHTSCLMALIANCNRDPKKSRIFKPDDFNPYKTRSKGISDLNDIYITSENIGILKKLLRPKGKR